MNAADFDIARLRALAHSPISNYVIPGLTSWAIGLPGPNGMVRLFECTRTHQEAIAPHSHRFGFLAWVLRGEVINRLWHRTSTFDTRSDTYQATRLVYQGEPGRHERQQGESARWRHHDELYKAGQCYQMRADEVHSIYFSRDTLVLMFEGPRVSDESIVLEPVVDEVVVPTFKVEPWMFRRQDWNTPTLLTEDPDH